MLPVPVASLVDQWFDDASSHSTKDNKFFIVFCSITLKNKDKDSLLRNWFVKYSVCSLQMLN